MRNVRCMQADCRSRALLQTILLQLQDHQSPDLPPCMHGRLAQISPVSMTALSQPPGSRHYLWRTHRIDPQLRTHASPIMALEQSQAQRQPPSAAVTGEILLFLAIGQAQGQDGLLPAVLMRLLTTLADKPSADVKVSSKACQGD